MRKVLESLRLEEDEEDGSDDESDEEGGTAKDASLVVDEDMPLTTLEPELKDLSLSKKEKKKSKKRKSDAMEVC